MPNNRNLLLILILLVLSSVNFLSAGMIEEESFLWKPYYQEVEPQTVASQWQVPFKTGNRSDLDTLKIISPFGSECQSHIQNYLNTGVDILPGKNIPDEYINVYPAASGTVCSIHLSHPNQTVVIKHKLPDDQIIYTAYKHLCEIYVKNGQDVTPDTVLGRLYTKEETKQLRGDYAHLHLEIRKTFDDYGVASWATMNKTALYQRFYDPFVFLVKNIKTRLPVLFIINPAMDPDDLSQVTPLEKVLHQLCRCEINIFHYKTITRQQFHYFRPAAVFITGQTRPWNQYKNKDLEQVKEIISTTKLPVFGINGGQHLIAMAFKSKVNLIKGDGTPLIYDGFFYNKGYLKTEIIIRDLVLNDLSEQPVFYTSHYEEIKELSPDFDILIKGAVSEIQMIKHKTRPVYGVQFNPEFPAGKDKSGYILLKNFIKLYVTKDEQ